MNTEGRDVVGRLRELLTEYEAALADLDFETGAGWFRLDAARDELIGVLGLDPGGDDPLVVPDLLAVVEAAKEYRDDYTKGLEDLYETLARLYDGSSGDG